MVIARRDGDQWVVVHQSPDDDGQIMERRIADGFISELAALGWIRHSNWEWLDLLQSFQSVEDELNAVFGGD